MHFLQSGRHSEGRNMIFQYGFFSRILSCTGLIFLFTAFVAPSWIETISANPTSTGLWSFCTKNGCREIVSVSDNLRATRILMSISIIGGLVAVSLAFLTNTSGNNPKWPLFTNLGTGLMTLATMLMFGLSKVRKVIVSDSGAESRHPVHFSWAYILGCLASACFLLSALLYVLIMLQDVIKIHSKTHITLGKTEHPLSPV